MTSKTALRWATGLIMVALSAFLFVSLATHAPHQGPFPDFAAETQGANACGVVGAHVSAYGLALLGYTSYVVAAGTGLLGVMLLFRIGLSGSGLKIPGFVLFAAGSLLLLAIVGAGPGTNAGSYVAGSSLRVGALGILWAGWSYNAVGATGTFLLCGILLALGAGLACGPQLVTAGHGLLGLAQSAAGRLAGALRPGSERRAQPVAAAEAASDSPIALEPAVVPSGAGGVRTREPGSEPEAAPEKPSGDERAEEPAPPPPVILRRQPPPVEETDEEDDTDYAMFDGEPTENDDYTLPPVSLLDEIDSEEPGEDEEEIRDRSRMLETTLGHFSIEARVVRVQRGPVITMYEVSLAPGTKVSRVESLADDLAIALKAPNVRIVAPLPGRNTVGIEVPNADREIVGVRELMAETRRKIRDAAIPLFLGKDTAGSPLVLDLARCPHLLVAGSTGSGKSVAINAMITSILLTRTPSEVQLLLIDPKAVEFSDYGQLPHLICPVLTDMKKAASVLKWACKKMDDRYSLLASVGVRDLKTYNALGKDEIIKRLDPDSEGEVDDVPFYMPHIVIIVDEFGELMMVAAKEVESSVIRLSQKARAVGIHLICATQRPSVDVITGLIKSNLPARIAFQVASKVDSRTILDRNGAELLLGRGDMLLLPPGTSRLVRAQGSFVSQQELTRIVEHLKNQGPPKFRAELQEYHAQQKAEEQSDELYEDAVRVVLETQRGSVSLLQRRLAIGFSRAARLIDMMAEAGIVGPYAGSQARRVLMTLEQWDRARQES